MPLDAADEATAPDWTAALALPPSSTLYSPPKQYPFSPSVLLSYRKTSYPKDSLGLFAFSQEVVLQISSLFPHASFLCP